MAIAVCIGGGRRRTILVDGRTADFNSTSRNSKTASRLKLPIKFFILNNDGYASIRALPDGDTSGSRTSGANSRTGLTVPDLSRIAAAYDIPSVVIPGQRHLRENVRAGTRHRRAGAD